MLPTCTGSSFLPLRNLSSSCTKKKHQVLATHTVFKQHKVDVKAYFAKSVPQAECLHVRTNVYSDSKQPSWQYCGCFTLSLEPRFEALPRKLQRRGPGTGNVLRHYQVVLD